MSLVPIESKILDFLFQSGGAATIAEIAKKTGLPRPTVSRVLMNLVEREYVERIGKGRGFIYNLSARAFAFSSKRKKVEVDREVKKGDVLGSKYLLEDSLGSGSYGKVWKAKDESLDRTVAIKLLHGGLKDFELLKAEGKALSVLTHKNIVVVHELDSNEKNGWLVTEFVDGPSLQDYLANKVQKNEWCSIDEAKKIIEQCLEALESAHDKNRVHGDIKPANILVPKTGEVKLSDFGVAKILSGTSESKREYPIGYERQLGSPSYAAYEILEGQPRDFQSDLFSVGILAYVLMTSKHPFMHPSGLVPISQLTKNNNYTPPKPSELVEGIDEKFDQIIMRLLERDKKERFQKAREVLDQWRERVEIECPKCNSENPVSNRFCGQCGHDLRAIQAVKSDPERDLNASFALFTAGRTGEAIEFISQSLVKHKKFVKGWNSLGYMLNYERRYEEAEKAVTKSITIDQDNSRAYQTRGFARSNQGKYDESIEDFTTAFNKEKDDRRKSMILYQRGYAKKLAGRFGEAYEDAILACELDEANPKARKLRESLEPVVKT